MFAFCFGLLVVHQAPPSCPFEAVPGCSISSTGEQSSKTVSRTAIVERHYMTLLESRILLYPEADLERSDGCNPDEYSPKHRYTTKHATYMLTILG